jgi:peptidoglycan/LPS O-acetylase OafA/YrhL
VKINLKRNNLDWLRLFFASQVVLMHALLWAEKEEQSRFDFLGFLSYLPGVPAFFFVSGFLIYASYEKSNCTSNYFRNRLYRLWPGLILAAIGGLFVVILGRHLALDESGSTQEYLIWFISQITIGQAWNPASFRSLGVGVINGALWTITVEILFYLTIPVIFWLEKKNKFTVHGLLALSFLFYCFGEGLLLDVIIGENLRNMGVGSKGLFDYLTLTPVVWGWMFMCGSLVYKNLHYVEKYFNYLILGFPVMLICILGDFPVSVLFEAEGNRLGIIYFIAFAALIIFFGFNTRTFSSKFDISYGVYIWHCVLINLFLILDIYSVPNVILATVGIAFFSWFVIEKPALKMKSSSLRY